MSPRKLLPVVALALLFACKNEQAKEAEKEEGAAKVEPGAEAGAEGSEPAGQPDPAEAGETETGEVAEPEPEPVPREFEKVGVAGCDAYVASYVACIDEKVPEAEREAHRRIVFDNVSAWKQTVAGGGAAERGLQTACKIATEQAKRATEDWGCAW